MFYATLKLSLFGCMATGDWRLLTFLSSFCFFPHLTFSLTVRGLGVTLDSELTFSQHANLVVRSHNYQLRQLRVVSRSLTHDAIVVRVQLYVTSQIDHSCSLLVGHALGVLARLDRVLRSVAHLAGRIPEFSIVSAYKCEVLHW